MKRSHWLCILAVLLCAALLWGCVPQTPVNSTESKVPTQKLSDLEEKDLLDMLHQQGISLPKNFEFASVRVWIKELEADPNHVAPIASYSVIK